MALSKNMIQIKNIGGIAYEEREAGEALIYPGMLCRVDSDGNVCKANTEGGKVEVLVAIEDSLQGKTVDDAYTLGNPVRLVRFRPGEEFHVRQHGHTSITEGEQLVSKGDGTARSASDSGSYGDTAFAVALETQDLSDEDADVLLHCRVL